MTIQTIPELTKRLLSRGGTVDGCRMWQTRHRWAIATIPIDTMDGSTLNVEIVD